MGHYKPFFIRQRAAMGKKSPFSMEPENYTQDLPINNVQQPSYDQPSSQIATLNTTNGNQELNQGQQQDQIGINTSDFVANMYKDEVPLDRNQRLQAKIDAIGDDGNQARKARLTKTLKKRKARQKNRAAKILERQNKALNRIQERGKPKENKKKEEK